MYPTKIQLYKNKKVDYLLAYCNKPFKITIDIKKDPISITTSNSDYYDISDIYFDSNKYYVYGGQSNTINILDANNLLIGRIFDSNIKCSKIYQIAKWKDYMLKIGDDRLLKLVDLDPVKPPTPPPSPKKGAKGKKAPPKKKVEAPKLKKGEKVEVKIELKTNVIELY